MIIASTLQAGQICKIVFLLLWLSVENQCEETSDPKSTIKCGAYSKNLKYTWGDALIDPADCIGPGDLPYPSASIARMFRKNWPSSSSRSGRSYNATDPYKTKRILLQKYADFANGIDTEDTANAAGMLSRTKRDFNHRDLCQSSSPARLCKTRYNTTAPMYGVSLTSGQPVTIVQKFPDLLQQVIYEVCESSECDIVRGECTQTYVPYLFLVIPLGPVTLTGQDYVLVESGCVCKPKYSSGSANGGGSSSSGDSMSALPTL
ncbi:uncharacterized protein LOC135840957 [Planococcus citri]|uniref:uncharacterized protein LOC135840957 n=1 Tax=Planococcus citri TaxID=170843 RepID=UPI0031F82AAA